MSDLICIRPHPMLGGCVAGVFNKGLQNAPAVAEILWAFLKLWEACIRSALTWTFITYQPLALGWSLEHGGDSIWFKLPKKWSGCLHKTREVFVLMAAAKMGRIPLPQTILVFCSQMSSDNDFYANKLIAKAKQWKYILNHSHVFSTFASNLM